MICCRLRVGQKFEIGVAGKNVRPLSYDLEMTISGQLS
jgi:hypothetical protein